MPITNLIDDPSFLYIYNDSNYSSNISPTGLRSFGSNDHLNFNLRRNDGADSSKYCLFPQYYNTNYSQWVAINYQTMGGQTFIDNLSSWSGITLPSGANNKYLCIPYPSAGDPLDFTSAYWTSMGNNTTSYVNVLPYASIIASDSSSDDPSGGSSDFSGIIGAITLIPATIIMVSLFKMISNIFLNRKVRG